MGSGGSGEQVTGEQVTGDQVTRPGSGLLEQLLGEVPEADVGVLGHRAEPGVRGSGDPGLPA